MKYKKQITRWMMSNIIKRLIKLTVFIFFMGLIFNCSENEKISNWIDITFENSEKVKIEDFKFYVGKNDALFIYIPNSGLKEKLKSKSLKRVEFIINDSIYHSTIIKSFFSRKIIDTKYYIQVDNQTKKIVSDSINGKEMFFVGWNSDVVIPKELLINDNSNR